MTDTPQGAARGPIRSEKRDPNQTKHARLFVNGVDEPIELPILKPSLGQEVIDIGKLTDEATSPTTPDSSPPHPATPT